MRREHFNLRPEDVEQCASSILHDNVKLKGSGRKCHAQVLWHVVLYAAAQITTLADLPPGVPSGQCGPRLAAFTGLLMGHFGKASDALLLVAWSGKQPSSLPLS